MRMSTKLLHEHCRWLLEQYVPAYVGGDGNCFFRAVSLALCGTEEAYCQIRLLAAIETLLHPDLYDKDAESYYAPYKADYCLYDSLNSYAQFVCDIAVDGCYADMHTVLAVSAVVQKPIQMRWPDERDTRTSSYTKLVKGRDVQTENAVNILWTCSSSQNVRKAAGSMLTVNHFVPLIACMSASSSGNTTSVQAEVSGPAVVTALEADVADDDNDSVSLPILPESNMW